MNIPAYLNASIQYNNFVRVRPRRAAIIRFSVLSPIYTFVGCRIHMTVPRDRRSNWDILGINTLRNDMSLSNWASAKKLNKCRTHVVWISAYQKTFFLFLFVLFSLCMCCVCVHCPCTHGYCSFFKDYELFSRRSVHKYISWLYTHFHRINIMWKRDNVIDKNTHLTAQNIHNKSNCV